MRKLLFVVVIVLVAGPVGRAQVTDQEIGLIGSILKSEIKVFFAQNIELSTSEADIFWEIYDEYEAELKPISNQRIDILKNVIEDWENLTEDVLHSKIKGLTKVQKKRIKVRMKYYKKLKRKLGVKVASQFYQIDTYIYAHISASLNEGMPLVLPVEEK